MRPLFSIVTPSLNCGAYIQRNIASVESQGFESSQLEHWVIDGGSSDNTLQILAKHPRVKWISEKDDGLSDAVNKGVRRSIGEWIIWLNADDELAPGALQIFLKFLGKHPEFKIFAGDQIIFDYHGKQECLHLGWPYTFDALLNENTDIAQASIFVHETVFKQVGLIDTSFRYAMDYEWLVRACKSFPCLHIPSVLTHYHRRQGSIMDSGIYGQHVEFLRTRRLHGCSQLSWAEFRFRFYIATQPLRKIDCLRSFIRRLKTCFGVKVQHRYEAR